VVCTTGSRVAGAIFGDWTHRRGDAGGARAFAADLGRAKLRVAWSWEPPNGARIDQVRTSGDCVFVAAMPASGGSSGWDHATVYAIDAASGRVVARRTLPDPVPVASLGVEGRHVVAIATGADEPVFAYSLAIPDLGPVERYSIVLGEARRADVLDAWALPGGGLWLELEGEETSYASVADPSGASRVVARSALRVGGAATARDACETERALFVPASKDAADATVLFKLEEEQGKARARPWVKTDTLGALCRAHALAREALVYAVLAIETEEELCAQVIAVDRSTCVERWRTAASSFAGSFPGELVRLALVGGEVAMQCLSAEGGPCSDLLLAGPSGSLEPVLLGAKRRFVLDAAVGSYLLAHDSKPDGRVVVALFSADGKAGLLGRRAKMHVSIETPDVGSASAVYAGAGRILVKGEKRLVAIRV
jgi:hypothetical protein